MTSKSEHYKPEQAEINWRWFKNYVIDIEHHTKGNKIIFDWGEDEANRIYEKKKRVTKENVKYKIFESTYCAVNYREDKNIPGRQTFDWEYEIIDPMCIIFSWKDSKDNKFSFPVSFHQEENIFLKEVKGFIKYD